MIGTKCFNRSRIQKYRIGTCTKSYAGPFLLAVRAGKIRGQDCATCLIGWFASGGPGSRSEAGAKRQGGILTEVGLQGEQAPPTGKAFGDFWLQKLQQKKN